MNQKQIEENQKQLNELLKERFESASEDPVQYIGLHKWLTDTANKVVTTMQTRIPASSKSQSG